MGKRGKKTDTGKALEIKKLFLSGLTQEEIGIQFGVSRQRISQILQQTNTQACDGGISLLASIKKENDFQKRKARFLRTYGLEENEFITEQIQKLHKSYKHQKHGARMRGIGWELDFCEWINIWGDSGRLMFRGRGKNMFCMGRFGDSGPYKNGNVYVCSNLQNAKDIWANKPDMKIRTFSGRIRNFSNRTHCVNGHDRKSSFYRSPSGRAVCRKCSNIAAKKYHKKPLAIKNDMVYN